MQPHDNLPLSDYIEYPEAEMRTRAQDFYNEIKRRHTVREFSDRPVPREIIDTCLRAAGTAPSGANHQPWHFAVIGSPEVKAQVREKAEQEERAFYNEGRASDEWLDALSALGTDAHKPYLESAPWLIAIFAQRRGGVEAGMSRKNYYVPESVGIATGFLIGALHHVGLATLTHTPKPMNFLNEICDRPADERPYILLVTGYPAEGATIPVHATIKKPLEDIVSYL
ncbi:MULTISPECIES: nitroreductase family protein [Kordiimonas]|jgi:nitroreductase|uniref:nitroreductase family protein n=1 Tax=Kordiimonas TaxID=288021 RepID=UPI00257F9261|nr:nitroreductase family protein [Kordiimonas sp. UBA4487]